LKNHPGKEVNVIGEVAELSTTGSNPESPIQRFMSIQVGE